MSRIAACDHQVPCIRDRIHKAADRDRRLGHHGIQPTPEIVPFVGNQGNNVPGASSGDATLYHLLPV